MTATFDRLTGVPAADLRAASQGFTTWLADHPDVLGEALGLRLELRAVAPDALAGTESETGRGVVVATDLADSTDAHVGRLLALAAAHDARTIVWIGPRLEPAHHSALQWIERQTAGDVRAHGVEVTFVRIGDSPAAPCLTAVTEAAESHEAEIAADPTPDPLAYAEFWEACRERISAEHPRWTRTRTAPEDAVFTTSTGLPGLSLQMVAEPKGPQLRLLVDGPDASLNAERSRRIAEARQAFERSVDAPLAWRAPDTDDPTCVATRAEHLVDLRDRRTWPAMVAWLIGRQREFRAVLESAAPSVLGSAAS